MAKRINKRTTTQQAAEAVTNRPTALYIRVSTERQADEGFSLEAQEVKLAAYCVAQGWTIDEQHIYVDAGISGKSTDGRAAFNTMLDNAQQGVIGRIVAIKLDRIARNTKDFLHVVEQLSGWNCDLVLIQESFDTSTPHGKFALTMFAAMAELEASMITSRVMSGKAQKASTGGYNGSRTPLGYDYTNGTFQPNRDAETIRFIFDSFCAGSAMSRIAADLNDGNNPTAKGGRWYAATVRYILTNGFYCGLAQYDGIEAPGSHPAIVDVNQYHAAVQRLRAIKPGPRANL